MRIVLALLIVLFSQSHGLAVFIDTVLIGNTGNAPDRGHPFSALGAVPYLYRIGKYEITNAQYAEFLNAKAGSDPLQLYKPEIFRGRLLNGIIRTGESGNFSYTVKPNLDDKPVSVVSFYDAIRFANWLHNGQGNGDTESGAYTLLGGTAVPSNAITITRNPAAQWFPPNENEWYKAAFHDPRSAVAGGPPGNDNYWLFATASDNEPTIGNANSTGDINNPGINVANFGHDTELPSDVSLTTVGSAGPLSASFYGTFDQSGNVSEWTEQFLVPLDLGGMWGGLYAHPALLISAHSQLYAIRTNEPYGFGFRVATVVPEPTTLLQFVLSAIAVLAARRR